MNPLKLFLSLSLSCAALFCAPLDLQIKTLLGANKAVLGNSELKKGTSGVVVTKLDDSRQTIVARAIVEESGEQGTIVKFAMLEDLAQEALPRPAILPKVGDKARFYLNENRAAVIAKNAVDYQKGSDKLLNMQLTHPDTFAAILASARTGKPKKKDFERFCQSYTLGNIYFVIADSFVKVDCGSFAVLSVEKISAGSDKASETPFYQRTGKIDTGYLGMMMESVENYEAYYSQLLGLK